MSCGMGEMTFAPQFFSTCSSYFSHHGEQVPEREQLKGSEVYFVSELKENSLP